MRCAPTRYDEYAGMVAFRGCLWAVGTSSVWWSADGAAWTQATDEVPFPGPPGVGKQGSSGGGGGSGLELPGV